MKQAMEPDEIHHELGQIHQIRGLNVSQIGFISANGFSSREEGLIYYTGDDLYGI